MNKRTLTMILIVIALLTMAQECENGGEGGSSNTNKVDPFIGGTRGLSIQFAEEAPPAAVFDSNTDPFDIELVIQNVGEAEVLRDNVKIFVEGLNPNDFNKQETDFIRDGIAEDIEPTYKDFDGNILESPDVYITFPNLVFKAPIIGNNEYPIMASVCYNYKTESIADGCIRKNPRETDEGVCIVNEEKPVFNSGAPIQVSNFVEQPSGKSTVKYLFTITHPGSGTLYAPLSKCDSSSEYENVIKYKIESSVADLVCSGADDTGKQGSFKLRPGQEYVLRCTQQKESALDFIDSVYLELEYDYKESILKNILIKQNI